MSDQEMKSILTR